MTADPQVLVFIHQLREEHPRLGKEKIKPLLDRHCQSLGIRSPAVSSIGKIIKRQGLFFLKERGASTTIRARTGHKMQAKSARGAPAGALCASSRRVGPLAAGYDGAPIREVQTDNGAEFEGEFDAYLRTRHIPQLWSYPRCPRINGSVERHQRTLSEEFIQVHEDSIRRPHEFLLSQGQMSKMSVTHTVP